MTKDDGKFCMAELIDPPAELWPGYFWVINDRMEEKELLRQLQDMCALGAKSVCLHPLPSEMSPKMFGSAMSPAYRSHEYFELVRKIVEECHRLGMNFWLYDEGGWPSGGANGEVYARNPIEHSPKIVTCRDSHIASGESYFVPEDVLCAAIRTPQGWKTYLPGNSISGLAADTILRVFFVERIKHHYDAKRYYADVLSPQAMETFIHLTHERYAQLLEDQFGDSIRFAFTDEPSTTWWKHHQATWTSDMPEAFGRMKGYDLIPLLPELLEEASEDEPIARKKLRVEFHDVCSRLFVERYLLPIRNWCHRNGLLSGGHFGGEDEPHYNANAGYGHILRSLRALDLPGVDVIWRQLFPGTRSHQFPKYASSAARQIGQRYALSESFAVYGSGLTLAEMKWIIDQQYIRGISISVFSNYPYSTRDHFMACCRPHFGKFHPLWKYFTSFHAYVARLGYLLSRGQPDCHTAVYYDIRSIWAGGDAQRKAIELHERLSERLMKSHCDFDFVDDDLLSSRGGKIENGRLLAGAMSYDTLVAPSTDWMEESAQKGILEFVRGGGKLICVDGPLASNGGKTKLPQDIAVKSVTSDQVSSLLKPLIRLTPPDENIHVCKRIDGETTIYFFTNEAKQTVWIKASFVEKSAPCLCDPSTGKLRRLPSTQMANGTELDLEFPPWGSKAILFGVEAEEELYGFNVKEEIRLDKGWKLYALRRYSVGKHNYEITELKERPVNCELGDWRKYLGDWFSGDVIYQIEFECSENQANKPVKLDLGEVRYACEVEVNGHQAGCLAWMPFELCIDGMIQVGKNIIRITVSNTLANALHDPEIIEYWKNKEIDWPLGYDSMTREFEPDSFSSGLFGPVRILLEDL
jgi:hypothetical protein